MLGVQLDENLNWLKHIDYICSKASSGIGATKKYKVHILVLIQLLQQSTGIESVNE